MINIYDKFKQIALGKCTDAELIDKLSSKGITMDKILDETQDKVSIYILEIRQGIINDCGSLWSFNIAVTTYNRHKKLTQHPFVFKHARFINDTFDNYFNIGKDKRDWVKGWEKLKSKESYKLVLQLASEYDIRLFAQENGVFISHRRETTERVDALTEYANLTSPLLCGKELENQFNSEESKVDRYSSITQYINHKLALRVPRVYEADKMMLLYNMLDCIDTISELRVMFNWVASLYEIDKFLSTYYDITDKNIIDRVIVGLCYLGIFPHEEDILRRCKGKAKIDNITISLIHMVIDRVVYGIRHIKSDRFVYAASDLFGVEFTKAILGNNSIEFNDDRYIERAGMALALMMKQWVLGAARMGERYKHLEPIDWEDVNSSFRRYADELSYDNTHYTFRGIPLHIVYALNGYRFKGIDELTLYGYNTVDKVLRLAESGGLKRAEFNGKIEIADIEKILAGYGYYPLFKMDTHINSADEERVFNRMQLLGMTEDWLLHKATLSDIDIKKELPYDEGPILSMLNTGDLVGDIIKAYNSGKYKQMLDRAEKFKAVIDKTGYGYLLTYNYSVWR